MDGMQDQLLISIIIPTKNRCSLLSETLVSVRNQTYLNWEAVVVDDLSDDNTWSNLEELARHDSRIRPVLRAGPVGGAGEARNQGFAASCGQYVIFLDSDDLLAPTSLEIRIKALEQYPDMDAIAFDMEYFRQTPGESHALCVESTHLNEGVDPLDAFLTSRSPWLTSGPIWRREAVAHYGFWKSSHDLQYHTRALIAGALIKHINIIDGYVRIHENAQCSKTSGANYATWRNEFLNERIQLLLEQEMLTHRRKRLLGWSCLLYSLGCAVERPRLHFGVVFSNWNAASFVEKWWVILGMSWGYL